MIPRIIKGSIITAKYLNSMAGAVNELTAVAVNPPRQANQPLPPDVQNIDPGADDPDAFIERTRTSSTVDVSGVEISRIDSWSGRDSNGAELKLVFKNED